MTDAACDEALLEVLRVLLTPLPVERVRILLASDSGSNKASKMLKLMKVMGVPIDEPLGNMGRPSKQLISDFNTLKAARDLAVHSFYDIEVNDGSVSRFRSRNPEPVSVQIKEIMAVADNLSQCLSDFIALIEHLETVAACDYGNKADIDRYLDDGRMLLTVAHLMDRNRLHELEYAFEENVLVRLGMGPQMQWRILSEVDEPVEQELLLELNRSNGSIILTLANGQTVTYGDTWWRDITSIARESDPKMDAALIRRIGYNVQFAFRGGRILTALDSAELKRDLTQRVFGRSESDLWEHLPKSVTDVEGFRPNTGPKNNSADA